MTKIIETGAGSRVVYPYEQGWGLGQRPPTSPLHIDAYAMLSELPKNARVANLGCGDGNFERFAPSHVNFFSVDQSPSAVARLRGLLPEQHTVFATDITDRHLFDGQEGQFDAVVISRVIHTLSQEDQARVLANAARALKPGGVCFVSALADTDWKKEELEARGEYKQGQLNDAYDVMRLDEAQTSIDRPWSIYFFSQDTLVAVGQNAGLEQASRVIEFEEPTSFPHLADDGVEAHRSVRYFYVQFRKPEEVAPAPIGNGHIHGQRRLAN